MIGDLHHFDQVFFFIQSGQNQPLVCQQVPESVVELVAVTVALGYIGLIVGLMRDRTLGDRAGISPQAHCSTFFTDALLLFHQVDHRLAPFLTELAGAGVLQAADISGVLDHCHLHA